MNFNWFLDPITKQYFDFQGVTNRQTFWMYILYYFIGAVIVSIVANLIHLWQLSSLYSLGLLLPKLWASKCAACTTWARAAGGF